MIDYAEAAKSKIQEIPLSQLSQLSELVDKQKHLESQVERLEEMLKTARDHLRSVAEVDIPALLDEVGILSFTWRDGSSVSVKETMYASIPKKNKPAAAGWLIDHGLSSLVKSDVIILMDKGDNEKLHALLELLDGAGHLTYHVAENMNTSSVKAAIKELLAQGDDVPLDLFGVHVVRTTVIK